MLVQFKIPIAVQTWGNRHRLQFLSNRNRNRLN